MNLILAFFLCCGLCGGLVSYIFDDDFINGFLDTLCGVGFGILLFGLLFGGSLNG